MMSATAFFFSSTAFETFFSVQFDMIKYGKVYWNHGVPVTRRHMVQLFDTLNAKGESLGLRCVPLCRAEGGVDCVDASGKSMGKDVRFSFSTYWPLIDPEDPLDVFKRHPDEIIQEAFPCSPRLDFTRPQYLRFHNPVQGVWTKQERKLIYECLESLPCVRKVTCKKLTIKITPSCPFRFFVFLGIFIFLN